MTWASFYKDCKRHISDTKVTLLPKFRSLLRSMEVLDLFKEKIATTFNIGKTKLCFLALFLEMPDLLWQKT